MELVARRRCALMEPVAEGSTTQEWLVEPPEPSEAFKRAKRRALLVPMLDLRRSNAEGGPRTRTAGDGQTSFHATGQFREQQVEQWDATRTARLVRITAANGPAVRYQAGRDDH
jgi:hypothetical protein